MATHTQDEIFSLVLDLLSQLAEDWDYDEEVTADTWLVKDLGLESIDVVVLGTSIQDRLDANLPFAEFLSAIGQREVRDIQVRELVQFVVEHADGS